MKARNTKASFTNLALDEIEIIQQIASLYLTKPKDDVRRAARELIKECRRNIKEGQPSKEELRRITRLAYRLLLN